jgi:type III secretion system YscQ/HrcQ family protein
VSALTTSETQSFFSRLKTYSPELFLLDRQPLLDQSFSFPWEEFSQGISKVLGIEITLSSHPPEWKESDWYNGIASPHTLFAGVLPGCQGQIVCAVSSSDISYLFSELLSITPEETSQQSPAFLEQFSVFLSTQVVATAVSLPSIQPLSPQLTLPSELNAPGYLCIDVRIQFAQRSSIARIFLSPEFLESWKALRKPSPSVAKELEVLVNIEAGRTFLTPQELTNLKLGDLLLLQYPFFIPGSDKSRIFLTFRGHPLFRAKIKEDGIKILEMPFQHEAFIPIGGRAMPENPPESENIEFEETQVPIEEHEEAEAEPEKQIETESSSEAPMTEEEFKKAQGVSFLLSNEPPRIEDIPLSVIVQLAEVQMTVGELSSLQPGNLLKLDIQPENDVALVVNNRVFAMGELVAIGDHVGVRIKQLGFESSATTNANK